LRKFIEGKKIILSSINLENVDIFTKWENHFQVRRTLRNVIPITSSQVKKYLEDEKNKPPNHLNFEIWYKPDEKLIGYCGFNFIRWFEKAAEIGFLIGEPKYWNKGCGTEALFLLLEYGFNELNLMKMELEAYSFNLASQKIAEKVGMERELVLKENIFYNGQYHDSFLYGVTRDVWIKNARELKNELGI